VDELEAGTTIGHRYEPRRIIARGGICVIKAAVHRFTGRQVAIKQIDERWLSHDGAKARLLREARALEMARHPNVVDVLDAGVDEDTQPFLVMEQLIGRTLGGLLTSRQTLTEKEVVDIGVQICAALGETHARGIVHRDIKPNNVMLVRNAAGPIAVKVIDFGIASIQSDDTARRGPDLTEPGEVLGTPQYMAPELISMESGVNHLADVYSLGVVLYECLTAKVPHEGNFGAVLVKVCTTKAAPVRSVRPDVSPALERVVMRALSKAPGDRYPDMAALAEALRDAEKHFGQSDGDSATITVGSLPAIPMVQRRRFERQAYVTLVRIVQEDGAVLDGRSEDISEGGMLAVTDRACTDGASASIRFALPLSGRIATVPSTLRWVRGGRGRVAAGLQFEDLEAAHRNEIGQYVALMGKSAKE